MRKIILIFLCIISFSLTGCKNITSEKINEIQPPTNLNLSIEGEWEIVDSKVLESSVAKEYKDINAKGKKIILSANAIQFDDKQFLGITHKLKLVKDDYVLSYEANFIIRNLNLGEKEIEVYSGNYKQGILYEFIRGTDDRSYIYFSGILYEIKKISDIEESIYITEKEQQDVSKNNTAMPEGVLLGLKTPGKKNPYGEIIPESYRTIWISVNDGEVVSLEERNNIIFPRMDGIWTLEKNVFKDDKNYIEYFQAKSLDGKSNYFDISTYNGVNTEKSLYRTINFVGNDYVATEVYEGEKFDSEYTRCQVLPIDNLLTDKPMVIQDIYSKEANTTYKLDYEQHMKSLSQEEKKNLSKYINYENFTLGRGSGKWNIIGRISPIDSNRNYIDYPVNLKPNKKLLNYDTLLIPWKVIKGKIPFVKDAFTSPGGNTALIVYDDEIEIYKIDKSDIKDNPIATLKLNEGEEIIMAEWATGEYVNKWYNVFKEESKPIK